MSSKKMQAKNESGRSFGERVVGLNAEDRLRKQSEKSRSECLSAMKNHAIASKTPGAKLVEAMARQGTRRFGARRGVWAKTSDSSMRGVEQVRWTEGQGPRCVWWHAWGTPGHLRTSRQERCLSAACERADFAADDGQSLMGPPVSALKCDMLTCAVHKGIAWCFGERGPQFPAAAGRGALLGARGRLRSRRSVSHRSERRALFGSFIPEQAKRDRISARRALEPWG